MSHKTKEMHSWKPTGFDPDTNEPNLWTCRKKECQMVRAMDASDYGLNSHGRPRFEYSRKDGTVIVVNPKTVPKCGSAVWAKARALGAE